MSTPIPEEIASSLLAKENNKSKAREVLNRPTSAVPGLLVTALIGGLGGVLQSVEKFEAPMWVSVLLIVGVGVGVGNMMDLWTTRRRLEAAITLLELQRK
jgi:hypothetical protein